MAELTKPTTAADLPRPFERIGEPGWAARAKEILISYDVPVPTAIPPAEIASVESRLGVVFPDALRQFLSEIGPLDLDGFRFLGPSEICFLDEYGARVSFAAEARALLPRMLAVVDYMGSDYIAWHVESGRCARCGHDPAGFSNWLPSFDAVVQIAFLNLPIGGYGWLDRALDELVADEQARLFGTKL